MRAIALIRLLMPALAVVAQTCVAAAMSMTPMHMEITAVGGRSRTQFQVTNSSSAPLPVEIVYERLSYAESGERQISKAGDELAIFPITALIAPGGTQTFRVQWVGTPDLDKSRSYLLTARQLPVKSRSDGRSQVQVVTAFAAILNVAPVQGVADLKLVSSAPAKTPQGKPALSILVENPSNVHGLISNAVLRVGGQTLNQGTLLAVVGIGVVEPHKRRRFVVPLTDPAAGTASLEYRPSR